MSDHEEETLAPEHHISAADEKKKKKKRKGKNKKAEATEESSAPLPVENGEAHPDEGSDNEAAARRKQEEEEIARLAAEIEAKKLRDAEETERRENERLAAAEATATEPAKSEEPEHTYAAESEISPNETGSAEAGDEDKSGVRAATPDREADAVDGDVSDDPGLKGKEPEDEVLAAPASGLQSTSASQAEDSSVPPEQRLQRQREDTYERAKSEVRVSDSDIDNVANFEKHKHVVIRKRPEQSLGFMITETGRTSLLPCIFISHVFPGSAAAKSGELFVGDHILSVNGMVCAPLLAHRCHTLAVPMSVVGLPFAKVLDIFRAVANAEVVELIVVPVDPVAMVTVSRHDSPTGKLGFDVLHGEIISVDKDGPADKAGLKAGHRITEINGQSVVDHTHEQIVQALQVEKVLLKTMPRDLFQTLMAPNVPPTQ